MDKVEMREGGGTDLGKFQKSSAEGLKQRCFLCRDQIVGGRRWRLRVILDADTATFEWGCWPCYSKVSLSGEIRIKREGVVLVVRVSPSACVEAGSS
ncbi:hypothetical protein ES703_99015 [subsurface metagenome]